MKRPSNFPWLETVCSVAVACCLFAAFLSTFNLSVHAQTAPGFGEGRFNLGFTISTSGTPVRISAQSLKVDRLMIQADPANTGTVTIMLGVPTGTTCSSSNVNHVSGKLLAGQAFSDPQGGSGNSPSQYEDLAYACLDSTVNTDKIIVTGWRRGN